MQCMRAHMMLTPVMLSLMTELRTAKGEGPGCSTDHKALTSFLLPGI